MDIIPVIDVARGAVVRAKRGDRANYKPIETPLSETCDPFDVAAGLHRLHPFGKVYLADLDGIEGRGRNVHLAGILSRAMPGTDIWVDAGTGSRGAARALLASPVTTLVIGSETLESVAVLKDIIAEAPGRTVLSLDFRGDEFLGPEALLNDVALWPHNVIVMTLARIGSGEGPDVARIRDIARRSEGRRIYAAGGMRHRLDLDAVRAAGACGALIASALHEQKITAGDLKEITSR
ncbi:MAG: HisA/HisF-related TIM barrel protein [Hyphomicrobium sp.]|nr:nickel transporter [Hyphomicrobium sp.]